MCFIRYNGHQIDNSSWNLILEVHFVDACIKNIPAKFPCNQACNTENILILVMPLLRKLRTEKNQKQNRASGICKTIHLKCS